MAKLDEASKKIIKEEIRNQILMHGPGKWDEMRVRYPQVSRATFYRMVAEVQKAMETETVANGSAKEAQARIRARSRPKAESQAELKSHLPAAPSPAVIAGEAPRRMELAFDFMAYFQQIVSDANAVRAKMFKRDAQGNIVHDAEGNPVVLNPVLLDRNIARRLGIIESWLKSQELIYNYERLRELYNLVIEAVGRADADTQAAIVAELRELNNKRGITMDAVLR